MTVRIEVGDLVKRFPTGGRRVINAVNGVSLDIAPGETLGLVGESGAGKSTVGRCMLRLVEPTSGRVMFDDIDVGQLSKGQLRRWRRSTQMIFQDPFDSMNPRWRVGAIVGEPLRLHTNLPRSSRVDRVKELLAQVRLPTTFVQRYPRELSGGEAQRVGIARAIATNPSFLVLDEPTSSLDLSVRAGVLEVLEELQRELGLTYLLISHDLRTVAAYSNTVAVMYLGVIVERGPAERLFEAPQHPYTQALLSASLPADPQVRPARHILEGEIPSPMDLPEGCLFASRCPLVRSDCKLERPAHRMLSAGHTAACVRIDDNTNELRHLTSIVHPNGAAE